MHCDIFYYLYLVFQTSLLLKYADSADLFPAARHFLIGAVCKIGSVLRLLIKIKVLFLRSYPDWFGYRN
jgi:hypothetical protein